MLNRPTTFASKQQQAMTTIEMTVYWAMVVFAFAFPIYFAWDDSRSDKHNNND